MVPYRGHTIVAKHELKEVLSRNLHRPKLVLFTQKKHVPLLFKLLSNEFAGQATNPNPNPNPKPNPNWLFKLLSNEFAGQATLTVTLCSHLLRFQRCSV